MKLSERIVNGSIKGLARFLLRMDDADLAKIPDQGPLILVVNHINFLDAPVMYTHIFPKPITGLAKEETWNNPGFRFLFNLWEAIPIKRGTVDWEAFRSILNALDKKKIVAIAPEGTRSHDGKLQEGRAGIIPLAQRSGALLLPMVYYGGEDFWPNLKRLRRTDFHIVVGKAFRLKTTEKYVQKEDRQQIMDEIMYCLAALLPPEYRGKYSDLTKATQNHLNFES
jgi:1-acyl-sn-glycerol-3-phosphate acyltransferase